VFRRIHPGTQADRSIWPATVPAVAQILSEGLDLAAGITVLAGENGAGKSTVVEVLAEACGLNPQGGSGKARFQTRASEPGIGEHLWAERGPAYPAWTYFLRADQPSRSCRTSLPDRRPQSCRTTRYSLASWLLPDDHRQMPRDRQLFSGRTSHGR
jgi:predicted ATPase